MSSLSEVSVLISQRAADIEKAREVFTAETRSFVAGLLAAVRRMRSDPWMTPRVRIDIPREIDTESKSSADLSSQYAVARAQLRFKRGTLFTVIGEVRFGIEFDETAHVFSWQVTLVPAARFQRVDDLLWAQWKGTPMATALPGSIHHDKANTVRFVARPISAELTAEIAFNDVKAALEFVLSADTALANAVGVDPSPGDESSGVSSSTL